MSEMRSKPAGKLILIPWHIGHGGDVSLRAVEEVTRISNFVAEDDGIREHLSSHYQIDCSRKAFKTLPVRFDRRFLTDCLTMLERGDVGLICSSGVPCFIDPGAWLVREVRQRAVEVRALAGASALTTVLSLSGIEWSQYPGTFTFCFYMAGSQSSLPGLLARRAEPIVFFVSLRALPELIGVVADVSPDRLITAFSDITATHGACANSVETRSARAWNREIELLVRKVEDVTLIVHAELPAPTAP